MIKGTTLEKVLELRKKNGLEASERALQADLDRAGTKYSLEPKPRYRAAGESPVFIAGKYLTKYGVCPATGESDQPQGKRQPAKKPAAVGGSSISEEECIKVLAGKGFNFVRLVNSITGQLVEERKDPKIEKLNFQYSPIAARADHEVVYVTQTTPQIQVSMTLDRFLQLTGTKP
jgi:hypothetical protein